MTTRTALVDGCLLGHRPGHRATAARPRLPRHRHQPESRQGAGLRTSGGSALPRPRPARQELDRRLRRDAVRRGHPRRHPGQQRRGVAERTARGDPARSPRTDLPDQRARTGAPHPAAPARDAAARLRTGGDGELDAGQLPARLPVLLRRVEGRDRGLRDGGPLRDVAVRGLADHGRAGFDQDRDQQPPYEVRRRRTPRTPRRSRRCSRSSTATSARASPPNAWRARSSTPSRRRPRPPSTPSAATPRPCSRCAAHSPAAPSSACVGRMYGIRSGSVSLRLMGIDLPPLHEDLVFLSPMSEERAAGFVELARRRPHRRRHPARRRLRVGRAQPARGRGRTAGHGRRRRPRPAGARRRPRRRARERGLDDRTSFLPGDGAITGPDEVDALVAIGASHVWGPDAEDAQPLAYAAALSGIRDRVRLGGRVLYGDGVWSRSPTPEADGSARRSRRRVRLPRRAGRPRRRSNGFAPVAVHEASLEEWDAFESGFTARYATWLATPRARPPGRGRGARTAPSGSATPTSVATAAILGLALPPAARRVGVATIAGVTSRDRLVPLLLVPLLAARRRLRQRRPGQTPRSSGKAECTYTEGGPAAKKVDLPPGTPVTKDARRPCTSPPTGATSR